MYLYLNFVWILEFMDVIQYNTTFLVEDTFAGLYWCYSGGTILPPVSEKLSFFIEGYIPLQSQILTMNLFIYLFILYWKLLVLQSVLVFIRLQCRFAAFVFFNVSSDSEGWSRGRNKALLSEDTRELMLFLFGPYSKLFLTIKMFHFSLWWYPFNKSLWPQWCGKHHHGHIIIIIMWES